jgi:hypothetical protein
MASTMLQTQPPAANPELNARSLLLGYVIGLTFLCMLVQVFIVIDGNRISGVSQGMTAGVALYYAAFMFSRRHQLGQVRFGRLVAHATTYAVVNASFQIHAFILGVTGSEVLRGQEYLPVDSGLVRADVRDGRFWGIGLTIHAIASIAQRGFED